MSRDPVFWAVCCLLLCTVSFTRAQQSLHFDSIVALRGVLTNGDVEITEGMENAASTAMNGLTTPSTVTTRMYSSAPDVLILSSAWFTGTAANAETGVYTLQARFASWNKVGDPALSAPLNQLSVTYFQRQPNLVEVTDECAFIDTPIAASCPRGVTVKILTLSKDSAGLQSALCKVLPTECDLVTLVATETQVAPSPTGNQESYTAYSFSIEAHDRSQLLVDLVVYASHASVLSSHGIVYMFANGTQVYYTGDAPILEYEGDTGSCTGHYWYLIFLIILAPLFLIAAQRYYYRGRISGRKNIREREKEIRAGVYMRSNLWSQQAMFNPGQMGTPSLRGTSMHPQWGPPQQQQQWGGRPQWQQGEDAGSGGQWPGGRGTSAQSQWGPPYQWGPEQQQRWTPQPDQRRQQYQMEGQW